MLKSIMLCGRKPFRLEEQNIKWTLEVAYELTYAIFL
jgi:hypothetical protein